MTVKEVDPPLGQGRKFAGEEWGEKGLRSGVDHPRTGANK